jgi:hypothetical protein
MEIHVRRFGIASGRQNDTGDGRKRWLCWAGSGSVQYPLDIVSLKKFYNRCNKVIIQAFTQHNIELRYYAQKG